MHETIGTVVSPRAALRFKPTERHTLRLAWGQAFRAPSVIETHLDVPVLPVAILYWSEIDATLGFGFFEPLAQVVCAGQPDNCGAPPGQAPDYVAVTAVRGSPDIEEEITRSVELGYAASIGRFDLSATVFRNRSSGGIDLPRLATYGVGPDGLAGTADDIVLPSDPQGDGIGHSNPPLASRPRNLCLAQQVPPRDKNWWRRLSGHELISVFSKRHG